MANKNILLGDTMVGKDHFVFFIAEIGINHNGSLDIAKKLIDASFAFNWNCVKFQKRTPDLCVPDHQKNILRDTPWGRITYLEYKRKMEFEHKEYSYIDTYCKEKPISWSASVWDLPSLEFMLSYDAPFIKIPSAKLTEQELLVAASQSGKPVILSTGMSSLEEIDNSVNILEKHSNGDYVLMHTNSAYPAPLEDLNLRVINFLEKRYECIVGYSGHEYGVGPSIVAATLGAKVIERHITLAHEMWGTDQSASLEIRGMDLLYRRILDVYAALGDGIKSVTPKEMEVREKLRG